METGLFNQLFHIANVSPTPTTTTISTTTTPTTTTSTAQLCTLEQPILKIRDPDGSNGFIITDIISEEEGLGV
ncbi:MAG: hypothetical protein IRD7MM_01440 [Candidatus Midichloria mitochondrii]|uniref:Uncharacterized protein n=1 Tax=Midichloria mitochondrii (strain IricVA) TaxID=696127 RepID=F7XWZ2_MIDMI|nr:hypothetical protein [Candidatus Midichloria mitochondrii]AEI89191.1 hypothetical protein midi_00907 [Candidatus Midichloria mitochondrii IricVA]MDJ1257003.1 hypothetical protein [Candidatus Midichloria mitochondrii]MDJ1288759.1 hypothetical protein [Candidatus Midichloria mitochondrii]MDJ1299576.1 hypothetical protein [Candidatus Midichloria mitochondrii]MDJ1313665.1 hypothetical protein [Candidatus Midichloria mitochondrii]